MSNRRVLGLRFTNKGFAVAVLEGTRSEPVVLHTRTIQSPKAFRSCEAAKWTKHELDGIFSKYDPNRVAVKAFEGRTKDRTYEERIRLEGIAHLCAGERGLQNVATKRKSTIAKDFGLKGRGHYVKEIDTSMISTFDEFDLLLKDAVLVAWSELKE
jgi:hypothetical protein